MLADTQPTPDADASTVNTTPPSPATGPKTETGKRIAARNATTHGLFARDIVLPRLGEDPEAFEAFLQELTAQIKPRNLLERHYTEKIAAASWRLRRLHRWQAQLFENDDMSEDEVMTKLDRVMRHETTLHRQIDTSVKMIGRDLPHMFEDRAHKQAVYEYSASERFIARNQRTDLFVAGQTHEMQDCPVAPDGLDFSRLDTAPAPSVAENCQNEPAFSDAAVRMEPQVAPRAPEDFSCPLRFGEVARHEPEGSSSAARHEPEGSSSAARHEPEGFFSDSPMIGGWGASGGATSGTIKTLFPSKTLLSSKTLLPSDPLRRKERLCLPSV